MLLSGSGCGRVGKVWFMHTVGGGRWGKDLERVGGCKRYAISAGLMRILEGCFDRA